MRIGTFFDNLWHKIAMWIRPMALLISSLIIANGAVVSVVLKQMIDLNRSVGVIEGTIGGLPEDKKTVVARLDKLETGQNELSSKLGILNNALGETPGALIIAAEKVKDNFAAFDKLRVDVSSIQNQLTLLLSALNEINQAMYEKEDGLIVQVSDMRKDIKAIKNKVRLDTP